ncbi:MAG: helix-turn-helix domain-containing protein [Dehalococcoidia bacterium]
MMSITSRVKRAPSREAVRSPAAGQPAAGDAGTLLRTWRGRRRLSQMELAGAAEISTRHLSFIETGRAQPSRRVVLRLAEELTIPLRGRNALLLAAGFAPAYPETPLADPLMRPVRAALDRIVSLHDPYPALVVDRQWNIVTANASAVALLEGVAPDLLQPPVNVMRLSLHPRGLAPRTRNFAAWAGHLIGQLHQQVESSGDSDLQSLLEEVSHYPGIMTQPAAPGPADRVVTAVRYATPDGDLALFTTIATLGAPTDVTAAELAIETFYPADEQTEILLQQRARARSAPRSGTLVLQ